MAAPQIRFDPEAFAFVIGDEPVVEISRDDAVVASLEAVATASVASFEAALKEYEERDAATVTDVYLADVPRDQFDADLTGRDIRLSFLAERLSVVVEREVREGEVPLNVQTLLSPLLDRHQAAWAGDDREERDGRLYELDMLALRDRERDLQALFNLGVDAQALLDAAVSQGALTARAARGLLAGGRAGALLGQPEASWIDAKLEPHRTDSETAAFELAKDVAAFANTGEDAIIVYGIATTRSPGGDVLSALKAFELAGMDVPALRNTLSDRLTPLLTDLDVNLVEARPGSGYGYGWIYIPAQPSWVRPVLVRGAIVDGRVRGSHFSLPFRAGEDTRHWDASTVHSLIQAGQVALQQAAAAGPRQRLAEAAESATDETDA